MNCPRCQAPVEPYARFCRNCGLAVNTVGVVTDVARNDDLSHNSAGRGPALAPAMGEVQLNQQRRFAASGAGGARPGRRRGSGRRWLFGCLLPLFLLLLLSLLGWFFVARPTLNRIASDQLNQALDSAVAQIDPARAARLPSGPVRISETLMNNFLTLGHAPSSPVQQATFTVTPAAITLNFTLYGFRCSISAVPQASAGRLTMTAVHAQGIISLVLSDSELAQIINQHLASAQQRLAHPVLAVALQEHEFDLLLGPATSSQRTSSSASA